MKMGLCWMLVILLGCRSSQGSQSPISCGCDGVPKVHLVPANGSIHVLVPCPNVTGDEVKFVLRKDKEVIYNHTSTDEENSQKFGLLHVKPHKNREDKFVGFILTEATAEIQGIYSCLVIKMYPPPYIKECGQRILLQHEGFHCQSSQDNSSNIIAEKQDPRKPQGYPWIWITAVALLGAYSLIVTILALVSWTKLRKTDSQSDYMNTKPRAARGNKKNRGVQKPFPKYF